MKSKKQDSMIYEVDRWRRPIGCCRRDEDRWRGRRRERWLQCWLWSSVHGRGQARQEETCRACNEKLQPAHLKNPEPGVELSGL